MDSVDARTSSRRWFTSPSATLLFRREYATIGVTDIAHFDIAYSCFIGGVETLVIQLRHLLPGCQTMQSDHLVHQRVDEPHIRRTPVDPVIANDGRVVACDKGDEEASLSINSISVIKGRAFISIRSRDKDEQKWRRLRTQCLERLATNGISVEMLQLLPKRMRFVVVKGLVEAVKVVVQDCKVSWRLVPKCSKVCVVSAGLLTTAGVFYRTLTGLAARGIPVLHFTDSDATMSLIIPEANCNEVEGFLRTMLADVSGPLANSSISFDSALGKVRVHGEERRLGSRQLNLLEFLVNNVGHIVEVEEAARHLFGAGGKAEVAALRVHVHNLRKKIEDDPDNPRHLVTVPAKGYVFRC